MCNEQIPERDDYDVFLDSWKPDARLLHANIDSNLHDALAHQRLLDGGTGAARVVRAACVAGTKIMSAGEKILRGYKFVEARQAEWSAEFRSRLVSADIDKAKIENFIRCFAQLWIDGKSRRQDSAEMMAIKASIRDLDRLRHPHADRYVLNAIDDSVHAMFSIDEMAAIFELNENLLEIFIPDYLDYLKGDGPGSINHLYIRRGVLMPEIENIRKELHYLSSYSFALEPVEQFARTWTKATMGIGKPCIFAAPLPAVQKRVVAFAPFIEGMDIGQLELVVAPPTEETHLQSDGEHGGIFEFSFL
jgi:hypothetical protein